MSRKAIVYLGLGSNLGDREEALRRALALLSPSFTLKACSSIYETEPWGYRPQPLFLNLVCRGATSLSPQALLRAVKAVEVEMGRAESAQRYGPRSIDVDILLYDARVVSTSSLSIPHPRLAERAFVLVPLVELASDLRHPVLGQTMRHLLDALGPQQAGVRLWSSPPC